MERSFLSEWEAVSKAWLSPTILFLILSVFKIRFFAMSVVSSLRTIQLSAQRMCETANDLYYETVESSNYLKALFASAVEVFMDFVFELVKKFATILISTAIALITFTIQIYLGTITCLSTALIHGTLNCLADTLGILNDAVQKVVNSFLKEFNLAMNGLSRAINLVSLGFDAFKSLFGSPDSANTGIYENTVSKVNLTISSLKSITLPTAYIDDIKVFADNIPNFEIMLSNVSATITLPLKYLAQKVNQTPLKFKSLANMTHYDSSYICDDAQYVNCRNVNRIFMTAIRNINSALTTIIIVLLTAIIALAILFCSLAYFRQLRRMKLLETLALDVDPVSIGNRIQSFDLGIWARVTDKIDSHIKWFFCFTFFQSHCLGIGCLGFVTSWIQYLILQVVKKEFEIVLCTISGDEIHLSIQAIQLVTGVQSSIDSLMDTLNDVLFSSVRDGTSDILSKLTEFQTETNHTISSIFNGTPFATPIRSIIYCTIGRRINDVEKGLSWILRQLRIPVPQILEVIQVAHALLNRTDVYRNQSLFRNPLYESINDQYKLAENALYQNLKDELLISSVLVGTWIIYSLIGGFVAWRRKAARTKAEFKHEISWPKRLAGSNRSQYPCLDSLPHSSSSSIYEVAQK